MTRYDNMRSTDARGLAPDRYPWSSTGKHEVGDLEIWLTTSPKVCRGEPCVYLISGKNCRPLFKDYRRACLSVGAWLGGVRL